MMVSNLSITFFCIPIPSNPLEAVLLVIGAHTNRSQDKRCQPKNNNNTNKAIHTNPLSLILMIKKNNKLAKKKLS